MLQHLHQRSNIHLYLSYTIFLIHTHAHTKTLSKGVPDVRRSGGGHRCTREGNILHLCFAPNFTLYYCCHWRFLFRSAAFFSSFLPFYLYAITLFSCFIRFSFLSFRFLLVLLVKCFFFTGRSLSPLFIDHGFLFCLAGWFRDLWIGFPFSHGSHPHRLPYGTVRSSEISRAFSYFSIEVFAVSLWAVAARMQRLQ